MKTARGFIAVAAAFAVVGGGALAAGATSVDVQANAPQVAGDGASDTTAVFPTNKQNEPTIAVNPVDSRILLAGSNDEQRQPACGPGPVRGPAADPSDCSFFLDVGTSGIYRSTDGGATFTNLGLLDDQAAWKAGPFVSDGDPVIVWGPKPDASASKGFSYRTGARAYYASLASYKSGRSPYPPGKAPELLVVSTSDDNGVTWSAPIVATVKKNPNDFNDKEAIWVDDNPASPFFGRAYMSWTEFRSFTVTGNGSEPVMVSVSPNGGGFWSSPKQLSGAFNNGSIGGRQGSAVRTGPDGTVYVAWEDGAAQVVSSSADGGTKWSRSVAMGPAIDIADPIPGANFRTNSFASLAVDQGSGRVWAAWVNRTATGGRVVVTSSGDRGSTWAPLTEVSTAAEGYAFFQGLDVAPNGRVDLGYQALVTSKPATYGTGNATVDSWFVSKPATSASWSAPVKVSTASSDPAVTAQNNLQRQFFGDYNTLVSDATTAWFIYTDSRRGAGCPAVDAYQRFISGTPLARGDMADRIATRLGLDPYADDPSVKPAPPLVCPSQFGNSDAFVSVIKP